MLCDIHKLNAFFNSVPPEGLEPSIFASEARRHIQLGHGGFPKELLFGRSLTPSLL